MAQKNVPKDFDDDRPTVTNGQGFELAEGENPTDAYESKPTHEGFGPYAPQDEKVGKI